MIFEEPTGALIVGSPESAIKKIQHYNDTLGGISRLSFQMSVAGIPHEKMLRSIDRIGNHVAPAMRVRS